MNSKRYFSREPAVLRSKICPRRLPGRLSVLLIAGIAAATGSSARASSDAPAWMHALTSVSLPQHDEKTEAILLYSEETLTVQPNGKIKRLSREAYKILRPGGTRYGTVVAVSTAQAKVLNMHGWCIPAQGKDYEVKDKDALETSAPGVANGELVSDLRAKILKIPESEPGNIVGYEIEQEEYPYILQDRWMFQSRVPVREAHYKLQLPAGWEYRAVWLNATESKPIANGTNQWQWMVNDVAAILYEPEMPPWDGLAGQMIVSLIPPDGSRKGFASWAELGKWTSGLAEGRRDPSPEIKQKVAELTAGKTGALAKMQALANYVQRDNRYVAIELGIGGWQPHAAKDVYSNHYGDCKDKATLLSAMLKEMGVDSYYITVHAARGAVSSETPPSYIYFNHMILGIRLPDDVKDPSLESVYTHPTLGRILIFDPTNEMTPLGKVGGYLQGNYGLLVTSDGGDLIKIPQLPPSSGGIRQSAKLTLSPTGALSGEAIETLYGDSASRQRNAQRGMTKTEDQIKPIETLLAHSAGTYQITKAFIINLDVRDQPFQYTFSFIIPDYAKPAGNLLLVRPRVLGEKSSGILEKKEPRKYPVEFEGPRMDVDRIEITIPEGYQVDELPPPADADYSFGSYHSKTEAKGNVVLYTRTFELKEVSVPLNELDDLKKFYRVIAADERNTAVLKPAAH
jgi:Domain of Unknown Function with PDB structure (DUF3857)/Transglutaminase-like superfamily